MPFANHNGLQLASGAEIFRFWSGGKTPKSADALVTHDDFLQLAHTALSNFFAAPIRCYLNGVLVVFPSAEHLFQALMAPDHVADFLVKGPIGELNEAAFAFVGVKAEERAKKVNVWSRTHAVGILAKMHIKRLKEQGKKRELSGEHCYRAVKLILHAKYRQNILESHALRTTRGKYLLEFAKGARREISKGREVLWGGLVEDGRVVGNNQMGALMMEVRDEIPEMRGEPLQFPHFEDLAFGTPSALVEMAPRELTRCAGSTGDVPDYHDNRHGGPDGAEANGVHFGVAAPPAASPSYSPTSPAYSPTSPAYDPFSADETPPAPAPKRTREVVITDFSGPSDSALANGVVAYLRALDEADKADAESDEPLSKRAKRLSPPAA